MRLDSTGNFKCMSEAQMAFADKVARARHDGVRAVQSEVTNDILV